MRYLITTQCAHPPFFTAWFQAENHFREDLGMIVYDFHENLYTKDGKTWEEIEVDHL
jgi:hypothetical protein